MLAGHLARSLASPLARQLVAQQSGRPFDWDILRDGMTPRRGSVAFTRASTATFVDPSTSYLATAAINVARIESDGLLIEASNTNYCLQSENLANASWSKFRLNTAAVTSPTNGLNALRLTPTAVNNTHVALQKITQNITADFCITLYAKPQGYNWLFVISDNTASSAAVGGYFDISSNALGSPYAVQGILISREITAAPNGYKRIKICFRHNAGHQTGGGVQIFLASGNGGSIFTGDATNGIAIYGVEIKPSSPDSYIPTTAAAATRSADVCTLAIPSTVASLGITYGDNTTATVSVTSGGTYQLPASQKKYKSIIAL